MSQWFKHYHNYYTGTWLICPTLMYRWLMDEEHNKSQEVLLQEVTFSQRGSSNLAQFFHPTGVTHTVNVCTGASFISNQQWTVGTVNITTLAASMPLFDFVYQLSIVVKWHWRDTGQLILLWCSGECFKHLTRTLSRTYHRIMVAPPLIQIYLKCIVLMWPFNCSILFFLWPAVWFGCRMRLWPDLLTSSSSVYLPL